MNRFTEENFRYLCDELIKRDHDLKLIIEQYGYPPIWTRDNTFATLILTILEQQVSLASAFAAFQKLKENRESPVHKVKFIPFQTVYEVMQHAGL